MLVRIPEHAYEGSSHFGRARKNVLVIALAQDRSASTDLRVHRSRESGVKLRHAGRERSSTAGFHDQMNVIRLHRPGDARPTFDGRARAGCLTYRVNTHQLTN
jgi:hypothetical protein